MVFQKLFLVIPQVKIFLVSFFINSTEGWSNGLTFKALPSKIVSNIKKQNNSPNDFSSRFKTLTSKRDFF